MNDFADTLEFIEGAASYNQNPQWIADQTRQRYKVDLGQLAAPLEARIAELSAAAEARPDHKKLNRGIEIIRKVAQLLDPDGAEEELAELANLIRVSVAKADNYAATAGQYLRQARDRCRVIGLDFNKWCAQANLGIKRSRIYQLMGPDPITAARQGEKHSPEPENVQSVDIAQLSSVERPIREDPQQEPLAEPESVQLPIREDADPFDIALAQFQAWYAELTGAQRTAVLEAVARVDGARQAA